MTVLTFDTEHVVPVLNLLREEEHVVAVARLNAHSMLVVLTSRYFGVGWYRVEVVTVDGDDAVRRAIGDSTRLTLFEAMSTFSKEVEAYA